MTTERTSALDAVFAQYGDTMTPEQVASFLHVRLSTVYEAFRTGRLPAYKVGGSWIIVVQEMKHHLREHRNGYDRGDG
ncbi:MULTISPECIES: helix-turn-helix domain-containing protein [unclassified Agrococcus]|uniref:helix-turn-helix domain-containing protein n=1 Tax=unclassified Agrococcus TaxID=2615065 RepID=UPI0036085BFC